MTSQICSIYNMQLIIGLTSASFKHSIRIYKNNSFQLTYSLPSLSPSTFFYLMLNSSFDGVQWIILIGSVVIAYTQFAHLQFYMDTYYEPEAIMGKRFNLQTKKVEYKVKWRNYPDSDATWEPRKNLENARKIVDEYDGRSLPYDKEDRESANESDSKQQSQIVRNSAQKNVPQKRRGRPPKKAKRVGLSSLCQAQQEKARSTPKKKEETASVQQVQKVQHVEVKRKRGRPKKNPQIVASESQFPVSNIREMEIEEEPSWQRQADAPISAEGKQFFLQEPEFFVYEIEKRGKQYTFLVEDHGEVKRMPREELVRDHPRALVEFYENHLKIDGQEAKVSTPPKRRSMRR